MELAISLATSVAAAAVSGAPEAVGLPVVVERNWMGLTVTGLSPVPDPSVVGR